MSSLDKALETQLANLQARSGKSLTELNALLAASGLTKHGELRELLKTELGMGHGDANTVVHLYLNPPAAAAPADGVLDEIYSGPKADLRRIHERFMEAISGFGEFEIAPKKGYVSLRRKKQFAMIGPATKTRVEVGLNMKGVEGTERLTLMPPGGMCQYRVNVTDAAQVDSELIGWVRQAYNGAG